MLKNLGRVAVLIALLSVAACKSTEECEGEECSFGPLDPSAEVVTPTGFFG